MKMIGFKSLQVNSVLLIATHILGCGSNSGLESAIIQNKTGFEAREVLKAQLKPEVKNIVTRQTLTKNEAIPQQSLFMISSAVQGHGGEGQAILIGHVEGRYIFMTNKHVLDGNKVDCNRWVSAQDSTETYTLFCSDFIYSLPDLDVTFIAMKPLKDVPAFLPFKLASTGSKVELWQELQTISVDFENRGTKLERSETCRALSGETRLIDDPNPDEHQIKTWSQPTGCIASFGDSGSPVLDEHGLLVGMIWGGKPGYKFEALPTLSSLAMSDSPGIWKNYTFMVPLEKIREITLNEISKLPADDFRSVSLSKIFDY